ncbi:unnamed protein product, partial [Hapterophycus canaliculatus]
QPLPRCFICLQQMGTLNPEVEARRRQFDQLKGRRGDGGGGGGGRASGNAGGTGSGRWGGALALLRAEGAPQAALDIWWSWCSLCNHGGHNGHLDDWFAGNDTCGSQGCDCKCASRNPPAMLS